MRYFLFIILFVSSIFATVISGNQGKVCVLGGSISVTSGGVSQTVNSGEITFIGKDKAPTKARKIKAGDLEDIEKELNMSSSRKYVYLKFPNMEYKIAKKIRAQLIRKGIKRSDIKLARYGRKTRIVMKQKIPLSSIKRVYPAHYKAALKFYKNPKNKRRTVSYKLTKKQLKIYHKMSVY